MDLVRRVGICRRQRVDSPRYVGGTRGRPALAQMDCGPCRDLRFLGGALGLCTIPHAPAGRPGDRPNVILIGMDSLRADLVDERLSPHVTPNTEAFMKGGTRFTNALTPLARTFPSDVHVC